MIKAIRACAAPEQQAAKKRTPLTDAQKAPLKTKAYGAKKKGAKLELLDVTLPALKSTQVQIAITHCGLCHTDAHMVDNDWGIADYPLVPGHEGYGKVVLIGEDVKEDLEVGDMVGVGWIRDSCSDCSKCKEGRENLCFDGKHGYQGTYLGPSAGPGIWGSRQQSNEFGCFSKVMRVEAKFAFKIHESLGPEIACPLMCAGGTVYEPILDWVKEGSSVGIGSIGGLGTLAIKLAKLQGAKVTAFSGTEKKRPLTLAAGADAFVCTSNADEMKEAGASLDVFIDTCPANRDVGPMMNLLKFDGVYVRVGITPAADMAFTYNWIPLIFTQKKIAGSIVTGSKRMNRLVDVVVKEREFIMKHDPNWKAQIVPFKNVNEAMEKLVKQESKGYRTVLKWE